MAGMDCGEQGSAKSFIASSILTFKSSQPILVEWPWEDQVHCL